MIDPARSIGLPFARDSTTLTGIPSGSRRTCTHGPAAVLDHHMNNPGDTQ
ncbi:hypothetical protein G4G28_22670 [Massilia sp. Dwa41.01b]|nr:MULTISPECIES: hypothetical protein [unclassified Massilia]QNA90608.1 hypothetical protein G4G28_22670 [Massilia sp. Dwa41.01b]QNA97839.1 hypothetical protein G4G31_01750 [Massilia sp. Se16.2.3]